MHAFGLRLVRCWPVASLLLAIFTLAHVCFCVRATQFTETDGVHAVAMAAGRPLRFSGLDE